LFTSLIVIIILVLTIFFEIRRVVIGPLQTAIIHVETLSIGIVDDQIENTLVVSGNEIGKLNGVVITMMNSIREKTNFAKIVDSGDLTIDLALASSDDQLGIALIDMKQNLASTLSKLNISADSIASSSSMLQNASGALSDSAS
jgi:methyl-accepting chemotaxis protein